MVGAACGVWPAQRGLCVAIVDPDGPLLFSGQLPDLDERDLWFARVGAEYGTWLEYVLTEPMARFSSFGREALERGHRVWIAPFDLVTAISCVAWHRPSPRRMATILARLPHSWRLRPALRRAPPEPGPRQLRLL